MPRAATFWHQLTNPKHTQARGAAHWKHYRDRQIFAQFEDKQSEDVIVPGSGKTSNQYDWANNGAFLASAHAHPRLTSGADCRGTMKSLLPLPCSIVCNALRKASIRDASIRKFMEVENQEADRSRPTAGRLTAGPHPLEAPGWRAVDGLAAPGAARLPFGATVFRGALPTAAPPAAQPLLPPFPQSGALVLLDVSIGLREVGDVPRYG